MGSNDSGFGKKIKAEIIGLKGQCNAGHKVGDTFNISCYTPVCVVFSTIHYFPL